VLVKDQLYATSKTIDFLGVDDCHAELDLDAVQRLQRRRDNGSDLVPEGAVPLATEAGLGLDLSCAIGHFGRREEAAGELEKLRTAS